MQLAEGDIMVNRDPDQAAGHSGPGLAGVAQASYDQAQGGSNGPIGVVCMSSQVDPSPVVLTGFTQHHGAPLLALSNTML